MGDSWGVPEYSMTLKDLPSYVPWLKSEPHYPGDCHTQHYLKNLGYDVHNSSHGGISNIQAMEHAESAIKNKNLNPDYIIWFHTALFRDFKHFQPKISLIKKYEEVVNELAEIVYKEMAFFLKDYNNPKLIAIGGQAPIVRNVFDKHLSVFFRIDDWRSKILNEKLPEFQAYGSEPMMRSWNWLTKDMDRLLSTSDLYRDKMTATSNQSGVKDPLFPDCSHPGRTPHLHLSEIIHSAISKSNEIESHAYIKKPGTAL